MPTEEEKEEARIIEALQSDLSTFNFVREKLMNQGRQSTGPTRMNRRDAPACAYRGTGVLKCAVGHCIPDRLYSPLMENKPLNRLISYCEDYFHPELRALLEPRRKILYRLQGVHDYYTPSSWDYQFDQVKKELFV